jgi:hypothetical protein
MDKDYSFNKYEDLWAAIHDLIDRELNGEPLEVQEYVVERLNNEFRFLDHLSYI